MEFKSTINENGRVVLPALLRKELGLNAGDEVVFTVDDNGVHLISQKQAIAAMQELFAAKTNGISLSEELIKMRRDEAAKE